ncbi:hypothetical protein [Neptuniibacter sp.]|uniref:hypothetical protein n=1 Tax=Neptuniibacter sp. TaxID=1962643 RepID=UPI002613F3DC|nr:hypothetical protein [Neptuniibacter sp.]MCP4595624.1 hypothetical protein [Neptuniibacter sp.]
MSIILTDEQIEAIDIQCGMDEIGHITTSTPKGYDYEHRLIKAQLRQVVQNREIQCQSCEANCGEMICGKRSRVAEECWNVWFNQLKQEAGL